MIAKPGRTKDINTILTKLLSLFLHLIFVQKLKFLKNVRLSLLRRVHNSQNSLI